MRLNPVITICMHVTQLHSYACNTVESEVMSWAPFVMFILPCKYLKYFGFFSHVVPLPHCPSHYFWYTFSWTLHIMSFISRFYRPSVWNLRLLFSLWYYLGAIYTREVIIIIISLTTDFFIVSTLWSIVHSLLKRNFVLLRRKIRQVRNFVETDRRVKST